MTDSPWRSSVWSLSGVSTAFCATSLIPFVSSSEFSSGFASSGFSSLGFNFSESSSEFECAFYDDTFKLSLEISSEFLARLSSVFCSGFSFVPSEFTFVSIGFTFGFSSEFPWVSFELSSGSVSDLFLGFLIELCPVFTSGSSGGFSTDFASGFFTGSSAVFSTGSFAGISTDTFSASPFASTTLEAPSDGLFLEASLASLVVLSSLEAPPLFPFKFLFSSVPSELSVNTSTSVKKICFLYQLLFHLKNKSTTLLQTYYKKKTDFKTTKYKNIIFSIKKLVGINYYEHISFWIFFC